MVSVPASSDTAMRAWAVAAVRTSAQEEQVESAAVRRSLCSSTTAAKLGSSEMGPAGAGLWSCEGEEPGGVDEDGAPSTSCGIFPER